MVVLKVSVAMKDLGRSYQSYAFYFLVIEDILYGVCHLNENNQR